jgi:hypothetical protein
MNTSEQLEENRKPENAKKYEQGFDDAREGFPPNRFMRSDADYMRGYKAAESL